MCVRLYAFHPSGELSLIDYLIIDPFPANEYESIGHARVVVACDYVNNSRHKPRFLVEAHFVTLQLKKREKAVKATIIKQRAD